MGYKRPERRELVDLVHPYVGVGQMARHSYRLKACCRLCHVELRCDPGLIARLNGAEYRLWNQQVRCRRMGCDGRMRFFTCPPGYGDVFFPLGDSGEWATPQNTHSIPRR